MLFLREQVSIAAKIFDKTGTITDKQLRQIFGVPSVEGAATKDKSSLTLSSRRCVRINHDATVAEHNKRIEKAEQVQLQKVEKKRKAAEIREEKKARMDATAAANSVSATS
jgi:hypothetical protein